MNAAALPSFALFRDVALRAPLRNPLGEELIAFAARQPPSQEQGRAYLRDALELVERALTALDSSLAALTEQRFAAGDASSLRQRLVGEPRRSVDGALNGLKMKLSGERQEWSRRLAKQCLDILDALPRELQSLATALHPEAGGARMQLDARWAVGFTFWMNEVFSSWSQHLAALLPAKTETLVAPELAAINGILGTPVAVQLPPCPYARQTTGASELERLGERVEIPKPTEVFVGQLKASLQSMAMLAGMIVIPVVTALWKSSGMLRPVVMALSVAPMTVLAVFQTRRHRRSLMEANLEKAREKLRKALETAFRNKLERFKPEAERTVNAYLSQAQQALLADLEPAITDAFELRERSVASRLAGVQLEADRLADQISTTKQLKGGLSQLALELAKRLGEPALHPE